MMTDKSAGPCNQYFLLLVHSPIPLLVSPL
jgi:hypothetical protein